VRGSAALSLSFKNSHSNRKERIRVTGSCTIREFEIEDKLATELYAKIISSTKAVQKIAKNLDMPEFQVRRIKDHVFNNTHQLDHNLGVTRFHPDLDIAEAWKRLEAGAHIESDLLILRHEHFESKIEGIFKTDYITAQKAANRAGYASGLNETEEVIYGNRLN